jgi:hypothetical protein
VKIRLISHLQAKLDDEIAWRQIELGALKSAFVAASGPRQQALFRAAAPMSYAHWEGFVKKAAAYYGYFLSSQNLQFSDLKPSFWGAAALSLVTQLHTISRKINTSSTLLNQLFAIGSKNVSINLDERFKEVGNLNHNLLMEIVEFLNLPVAHYSTKSVFIDQSLLRVRNNVAHGERENLDLAAATFLVNETISLLRTFKSDIENAATLKSYL